MLLHSWQAVCQAAIDPNKNKLEKFELSCNMNDARGNECSRVEAREVKIALIYASFSRHLPAMSSGERLLAYLRITF